MLDATIRQAEIAAEQEHVDRVYTRLAELRAEAETMRAKGYELAHGAGQEATFEQAAMLFDRDAMVRYANRLLQALDAEHEGLVFGRLDTTDGQALRIGRMGVRDAEHHNLVTDWRAPAAAAFYQATPQEPMDVLRRRVIHCSGETVTNVDDEPLMPEALPEGMPIIGEGALMAALGRARGEAMHNIVATIQREQDEAIRAPAGGVTEITGGPGTGKTAVALHRVAYLLYRERRRLGTGVLVVGPSPVFTSYISRVLPSMGETSAELRSLGELLDGAPATRVDPPAVNAVKGSTRMVRVLRRLVRQTPPDTPTEMRIVYGGEVIRLDARELDRVRRRVHRAGQPNQHRVDAAEALLEALARKAEEYADETFRPDRAEMVHELGERMEFHRFLVRWWPVLSPTWVLSWLRDRDRLARAAKGVLDREEIDLLAGSVAEADGWSTADVALLDELRVLLGPPPKRRRRTGSPHSDDRPSDGRPRRPEHYDEYSHIVVDEVQDVSPMQWRMLGRRGRYASWTLVGDPVQTSWPTPEEAAGARDEALGSARTRRRYRLRTNYRNSAEIFGVAAAALGDLAGDDDLPKAVRSTGVAPVVSVVAADALADATRATAAELLSTVDGTVAVIPAMDRVDEVREWVSGLADDRLRVVGSLDSKGLEYDGVVLVEPTDLLNESPTGRRALYVALTRATQRLTVLATDDTWLPGRARARP